MGRFIAALIVFLFPISVLSLADEASFPLDAALRWEGERHGTLGPTGRRIFADRLDCAPGFRGVFGYGGATDGFSNVMVLFFREPKWGQLFLTHEHTVWYPSHNEVFWKHDRIRVLERKCITDDDMLLDRIEIENRSDTSIDLEIQLLGNLTPEPARFLSKQIPLDLTKAANVIPLSDGTFALPGPEDSIIWPYRLPIQKDASTKPFPFQGGQVIDGIHYALAAPDTGEAPTLTALRCDQNEASRTLPEKIFLEVPDVKPAIAHLHLLC
ncbi:MAG: hypothetical protein ACYTG7_06510, partial [Planctomycetota bacterium]